MYVHDLTAERKSMTGIQTSTSPTQVKHLSAAEFLYKAVPLDSGIAEGTCKGLGKALLMHDECVE